MEDMQRFLVEYACYYNLKHVLKELTSFYTAKDWEACSVSHVRFLLVWLEEVIYHHKVDKFDQVINFLSRLYMFVKPVVSFQLYFNLMSKLKILVTLHKLSSNETEAMIILDQYFPEDNCCIPLPKFISKIVRFDLVQKTQVLRLFVLSLFHNVGLQQDYMKNNFLHDFNNDYLQDLHYSFNNFLSVVKEILKEPSFTKIDSIKLDSKEMLLVDAMLEVLNTSHQSHQKIIKDLRLLKANSVKKLYSAQFELSLQTPDCDSLSNSKSGNEEIEFVPDSFSLSDADIVFIPNIQQHLLSQVRPCLVKLTDRQDSFQQDSQTFVIYN